MIPARSTRLYWLVAGVLVLFTAAAYAQDIGREFPMAAEFERCRAIAGNAERLRCFERAAGSVAKPSSGSSFTSGWRLVRTPGSAGAADIVSIMHTADLGRSDLDFAGLMLRCSENDPQVLVVLVRPLPRDARPEVTVVTLGQSTRFAASVASPLTVLLPASASALARGLWLSAAETSLEIELKDQAPIRGTIALSGLRTAYKSLVASCPAHQK